MSMKIFLLNYVCQVNLMAYIIFYVNALIKVKGERMDYNIMKLSDLLSDLIGNVSETQLDTELTNFRLYARKLGVRDYDNLWVAAFEEDPSFVLQDGLMVPVNSKDREVYIYPSAKILVEKFNGNIYVYAASEEAITDLSNTMERFLNSPIEDFYTAEDIDNLEEMEKNNSLIDIKECLKLRDKISNNKYQLYSIYLSENYSLE